MDLLRSLAVIRQLSRANQAQAEAQGADLAARGAALFARIGEGANVPLMNVGFAGFSPLPQHCHANANEWCALNPGWAPVRGWLYFSWAGVGPAMFLAHSVVRRPDGTLIDITPQNRQQEIYPFLEHNGGEDDFAHLVANGVQRIWHIRA